MSEHGSIGPEIFLIVYSIFVMAVSIYSIFIYWKAFEKANVSGFLAIIPIVNIIMMGKIACVGSLWIVLMFVPVINTVATIYVNYRYFQAFNMSDGLAVLGIFIPIIPASMIAFSNEYEYIY